MGSSPSTKEIQSAHLHQNTPKMVGECSPQCMLSYYPVIQTNPAIGSILLMQYIFFEQSSQQNRFLPLSLPPYTILHIYSSFTICISLNNIPSNVYSISCISLKPMSVYIFGAIVLPNETLIYISFAL